MTADTQLADNLVVVRMGADPEPLNAVRHVVAKRAKPITNARRPHHPDSLEVKRRAPRISLDPSWKHLSAFSRTPFGSASYNIQKRDVAVWFTAGAIYPPRIRLSIPE